jgi:hypothetical protein
MPPPDEAASLLRYFNSSTPLCKSIYVFEWILSPHKEMCSTAVQGCRDYVNSYGHVPIYLLPHCEVNVLKLEFLGVGIECVSNVECQKHIPGLKRAWCAPYVETDQQLFQYLLRRKGAPR